MGRPKNLRRVHVLQVDKKTQEWIAGLLEEEVVPLGNRAIGYSILSHVDPIRLAAVGGLTVVLKPVIAGSTDLLGWYGKLFEGLGLGISGNLTPDQAGDILFNIPIFGGLYRALFQGFLPDEIVESMADPEHHNEILEWLLAVSAASLIVILGPSALSLIS